MILIVEFHFKGSWSTSSSPVRSPSPSHLPRESNAGFSGRYGTTSLQQRSRSPSPSQSKTNHFKGKADHWIQKPKRMFQNFSHLDYHQSYQVLHARRGRGRILPATPNKPSVLQIPESNVNFTGLSGDPTRVSILHTNFKQFKHRFHRFRQFLV